MLAFLTRTILRTFFREIVVEGLEHLPASGPMILTPNHPNGLLDPMLLKDYSLPFPVRFIAAIFLFRIPVMGWILRRVRAIPVVRHKDAAGEIDYAKFFAAVVDALAAGDRLVIFPEGVSASQPYMAPLRTGPARIFFQARERGCAPRIVPVGLNYERGEVFRSSVLISIAPPIDTAHFEAAYRADPLAAVRALTDEIKRVLDRHVFQSETFRDRKLMLLLDRLYAEQEPRALSPNSWADRLTRLKRFERGMARLRETCPEEINRLRHLLARYRRLSADYGVREKRPRPAPPRSWKIIFLSLFGSLLAQIGSILNWIPYHACRRFVWLLKMKEADAAIFKILCGMLLYPLAYGAEGYLLYRWLGPVSAAGFALAILPLTYFTLKFYEWRREIGLRPWKVSLWFAGNTWRRVSGQLARHREQIVNLVDTLSNRPELRAEAEKETHPAAGTSV